MSISYIEIIILTAYVSCHRSTNLKTYPYKSPESSKLKKYQLIPIFHTNDFTRQKSTETVNTLLEIINLEEVVFGY